MKKILAVIMTLSMLISLCGLTSVAGADESATVYVSISDDKGELVLTQAEVVVTDVDEDGSLTINDALYQTHEDYYVGGAAEGFASSMGTYGMQMDKLWGVANGGSYGYYVNNASAMGLGDVVKDGDYIKAFVYTDLTTWSDTYCFFDKNEVAAAQGEDVELTLSAAGYDADWNPVTLPVEGATITVNGELTEYKTDAEGKVVLSLEAGEYIISATSEAMTLVPPVCEITVAEGEDKTPDNNNSTSNGNTTNNNTNNNANTNANTNNNTNTNTNTNNNVGTNNTSKPSGTVTAPKTGDNSSVVVYVLMIALSVMFMVSKKKVYEK